VLEAALSLRHPGRPHLLRGRPRRSTETARARRRRAVSSCHLHRLRSLRDRPARARGRLRDPAPRTAGPTLPVSAG
jgi:hypothetical protein